jgi:hypothetical protein
MNLAMPAIVNARLALAVTAAAAAALLLLPSALADKTRINPTDQATARRDVLRVSDLPTNVQWTSAPGSSSGSSTAFSCAGYDPSGSGLVDTGRASSKYTTPGLMVESDAGLLQTPQKVSIDWKRTFTRGVVPCLRQLIGQASHGAFKVITVGEMPFAKLARYVTAFRIVFQATVSGKPALGVFDLIAMGEERTEVTLMVLGGIGSPADRTTAEAEVTLIDLRLAAVLAGRAFPATQPAPLAA